MVAQARQGAVQNLGSFAFYERILFACYGISAYLVRAIVPLHLSALYPYPLRLAGGGLPPRVLPGAARRAGIRRGGPAQPSPGKGRGVRRALLPRERRDGAPARPGGERRDRGPIHVPLLRGDRVHPRRPGPAPPEPSAGRDRGGAGPRRRGRALRHAGAMRGLEGQRDPLERRPGPVSQSAARLHDAGTLLHAAGSKRPGHGRRPEGPVAGSEAAPCPDHARDPSIPESGHGGGRDRSRARPCASSPRRRSPGTASGRFT